MALRGTKLNSAVLRAIDEANSVQVEEELLEGVQHKLLLSSKEILNRTCSLGPVGLLMDCLEIEVPAQIVQPYQEQVIRTSTSGLVDIAEVSKKIVEHVKNGSGNINIIIELVSEMSDEQLDAIIDMCARVFQDHETHRSFIIAMSATKESAAIVCSKILLPAFLKLDSFQTALDLYESVLRWLESSIVDGVIVPLLLNKDSSINCVAGYCKALFDALTDLQRNEALSKFSSIVDNNLQSWQLSTLSVILESFPPDANSVAPLTNMLVSNIDTFAEDRLMGKVILFVLVSLPPSTAPSVLSAVSSLVSNFKGSLRFRHKKALDNIAKQIQPNRD